MNRLLRMFRQYDSAIWIRVAGTALSTVTGFMIRPFLVLYLYGKMEGSVLLPMIVVGIQPLCGMLVSWFGGGLSDRYGRKPLMLSALLLQMLCMISYVFATEVWSYALISVVGGVGNALFMPAANAQITDMVEEKRRSEVFALMHTSFNIGAAVGPALGLLMFNWNPSAVFLLSAGSFLLNALLVHFKLPETAPRGLSKTRGERGKKPRLNGKLHRPLLLITALSLPVGFLYAQVETTFPLHLQTNFKEYQTLLASLLSFNGLLVIALQIWIARRTESMRSHAVVGFSYALFAAVCLSYGYSHVVVLLFAAEFLFTIGEMLYGPHVQKAISVMAPAEERGFYFSVYGTSLLLSRGIGPILGGLLLSGTNGETLFTVLGALIALAGFAQFRVMRGIGKSGERAARP